MPKIAFIGAGSLVFSQRLIIDILSFPALRETTFALVDIDEKRLDYARRVAERIIHETEAPADAIATGVPIRINGNVKNTGLIDNLPQGSCVEVPCLVDSQGVSPCHVGELPPHLAALNRSNIAVQEMAVNAALTGDRRAAFHAVAADPLTAAVLSLGEIQEMVDEMFEAEREWLPQFKA